MCIRDSIRIGQPVKLTADLYGKKVEYDGKVAGLGIGTGAAFALLPAQNATGNWIKVVQRVPVRIALDAEQLKASPLRVGLSMDAEIDVKNKDGKMLADAPRVSALTQTAVYSTLDHGADAVVDGIIAANLGGASPTAKRPASPTAPATGPGAAATHPLAGGSPSAAVAMSAHRS